MKPQMTGTGTQERRLAAILFADIVGYSRMASRDEARALQIRSQVMELAAEAARAHGGRLVKTLGDGALLEFSSAADAVRCALALQPAVDSSLPGVRLRAGLHMGDVVREGDDVHGHTVNVAARLQQSAPEGGVCASRSVYEIVRAGLDVECRPVPPDRLAGLPEPLEAVELRAGSAIPRAGAEETVADDPVAPAEAAADPADLLAELTRAHREAEEQDDPLPLPLYLALALGLAALSAGAGSLADWVAGFRHWEVVTALLRLVSKLSLSGLGVLVVIAVASPFWPWLRHLAWRLTHRIVGPPPSLERDAVLLRACSDIASPAPEIAVPVNRALAAYRETVRLAWDDLWTERSIPVHRHTRAARRELLRLLREAAELARVRASVRPGAPELRVDFEKGCSRLTASADRLQRVQTALARVYLRLAGHAASPGDGDLLRESLGELDAVIEVDDVQSLPLPEAEEALQLRVGVGREPRD